MTARFITTAFAALALVSILQGCPLSVEPAITQSEAVVDARVLGTWQEAGGSDRAIVTRSGDNAYAIEYSTEGRSGRFHGRLGQVGGRTILEVTPAPRRGEMPEPYAELLVPGYLAYVLDIHEAEIRVALPQSDSLAAVLPPAGSTRLRVRQMGHRLLIQGTTAQWRAVLASYLARPGVHGAPTVFRRVARAEEVSGMVR